MTTMQPTYTGLLGRYLRPYTGRLTLLSLLLLGGIAAQLAGPQVLRLFIDATQTAGDSGRVLTAAGLFIVLAIGQRAAALASAYVGADLGWRTTNRLRIDLTDHCLRLDMGFHKTHTPGELIDRIDGDCNALGNFFSQFSLQVLGNTILTIGILALLIREEWRVGIGLSVYTLATLALLFALQRLAVSRWAAYRQSTTDQFSFLEERFGATEDIRSNGAEAYTISRLERLTTTLINRRRSAELTANITFTGTNFLFLVGYALGLAIGAWLFTTGQASIGTAFLIVTYIGMLSGPLDSIREQFQDLQQAGASIGRISNLFGLQPLVREQVTATLPAGPLAVACEQLTFTYADRPSTLNPQAPEDNQAASAEPVLQNISFSLAAGKTLGLLGRTGSGKTTLTRLIARLYDLDAGTIMLGGVKIDTVALTDLRKRIGVVTQDVQIFQASIRNNLTLFQPAIDDTQIEGALAQLGLLEWVRTLPEGLNTQLGPGGLGLSAGEAQLLAFARVFLKDPGLVIMDEASSRLDPATERLLEQAVGRLLQGRTAIIIAHRLDTVQRADDILILNHGAILEYGQRVALVNNPDSQFARLLQVGMQEALA